MIKPSESTDARHNLPLSVPSIPGRLSPKDCNISQDRLTLEQRNTQVTVPFYLSDKGYGFLWNNPAVGWVSFAKNIYV